MSEEQEYLKNIFFEEAIDLFVSVENNLLALEETPGDKELINDIFRDVHTIKGSGSLFDFAIFNKLAHSMEDLLDAIRSDKVGVDAPILDMLFKSLDLLKLLMDGEKEQRQDRGLDGLASELVAMLSTLIVKESKNTEGPVKLDSPVIKLSKKLIRRFSANADDIRELHADGNSIYLVKIKLNKTAIVEGLDPLSLLRNLKRQGEIIDSVSNAKDIVTLDKLDIKNLYLNEFTVLYASRCDLEEILDIFEFAMEKGKITVGKFPAEQLYEYFTSAGSSSRRTDKLGELLLEDGSINEDDLEKALDSQSKPLGQILIDQGKITDSQLEKVLERQRDSGVASQISVRVNAQKLDSLVDLVGELVISHSLLMQSPAVCQNEDSQLAATFSQHAKVINDLQDQIMSLRMIPIESNFKRARRLVRDVALKVNKQIDLEISGEDTEIDKNIADDLNEILVHLIRNAIDHGIESPQERVAAGKHEAGTIELAAYPKGGNIVIEVKDDGKGLDKEKIIEKAVKSGLDVETKSDADIYKFIFNAGFSTAKQVTNLSGRGVGLDVVKKKLDAIRGKVEVACEPGQGTTFILTLQPTLAIIDGMVFRVGSERMIIPTLAIEESLRPTDEQIISFEGKAEAVMIRGKVYPMIRLHEAFSINNAATKPSEALVVLTKAQGKSCVILIDELIGQQQVVIKSLGERFKHIRAISGGAILGDGRVGLILDLDGLIDSSAYQAS